MDEAQKSQFIRLIDVFLLGPFMFYMGYKSKLPKPAKGLMMISGIATVIYNYNNYIKNQND